MKPMHYYAHLSPPRSRQKAPSSSRANSKGGNSRQSLDYEAKRSRNIKENNAIMASLGLSGGSNEILGIQKYASATKEHMPVSPILQS